MAGSTNPADDSNGTIINSTRYLPRTDEEENRILEEDGSEITIISIESEMDNGEEDPCELCEDPSDPRQVDLSILNGHPDLDANCHCGHSKTPGFLKIEQRHDEKVHADWIPDESDDGEVDTPKGEAEGPREKRVNGKNKYCHIAEGAATIGCKDDVPPGTKRLCKVRIGTLGKVAS